MEISQRLRNLRESLGLSQREFAKDFLSVSHVALSYWESGERPVPGPILKLMDFYESSLSSNDQARAEIKTGARELLEKWAKALELPRDGMSEDDFDRTLSEQLSESLAGHPLLGKAKLQILSTLTGWMADSKGIAMKAVQVASYLHPSVPQGVRAALANGLQRAKPLPPGRVSKRIAEELGSPPQKLFKEFSPKPFAVASIGQVHLARLKTGERIAVKVQYPEIHENLTRHFRALSVLMKVMGTFGSGNTGVFEEIRARVLDECDYLIEAENQRKFRDFVKTDPMIKVPRVFDEFSTKTILTTEFVEGVSFGNFVKTASQAQRNMAGEAMARFLSRAIFHGGLIYADPHPGNFLFTQDGVAVVDFGRVSTYSQEEIAGITTLYLALFSQNKERVRVALRAAGMVRDWGTFDFEEYWTLMLSLNAHHLEDRPCKILREEVTQHWKALKGFKGKTSMQMTREKVWEIYINASLWSLLADLGAVANWRRISLDAIQVR